jgi:exodeoxyribonuclease VII small subunit
MKFEDGLRRLEEIVKRLDEGNLPLDEALRIFEEGLALTGELSSILDTIEKKVEILLKKEDGSIERTAYLQEESS